MAGIPAALAFVLLSILGASLQTDAQQLSAVCRVNRRLFGGTYFPYVWSCYDYDTCCLTGFSLDRTSCCQQTYNKRTSSSSRYKYCWPAQGHQGFYCPSDEQCCLVSFGSSNQTACCSQPQTTAPPRSTRHPTTRPVYGTTRPIHLETTFRPRPVFGTTSFRTATTVDVHLPVAPTSAGRKLSSGAIAAIALTPVIFGVLAVFLLYAALSSKSKKAAALDEDTVRASQAAPGTARLALSTSQRRPLSSVRVVLPPPSSSIPASMVVPMAYPVQEPVTTMFQLSSSQLQQTAPSAAELEIDETSLPNSASLTPHASAPELTRSTYNPSTQIDATYAPQSTANDNLPVHPTAPPPSYEAAQRMPNDGEIDSSPSTS